MALSPLDRMVRQNITWEIRELTDVMTQMDLGDIYRTFHANIKKHTFFSTTHGTLSKIDHILGKKSKSPQIQKKLD